MSDETAACHSDVCDGDIKPIYDTDSGRHVIGYNCNVCNRLWNDRKRDGMTFRYLLSDAANINRRCESCHCVYSDDYEQDRCMRCGNHLTDIEANDN